MKKLALLFFAIVLFFSGKAQYWQAVSSGTHKKLLSVSFGNPRTGYISAVDSLILKTTDGGVTWLPFSYSGIDFTSTINDITDINFVDSLTGFVTVSNIDNPTYTGTIFKTTDAGATWHNISTVNMVSSKTFFFDEYNGYQVGAAFFSGYNVSKYKGSVWVMADWESPHNFSFDPDNFLHAIDFRNPSTGIVGGDSGYVFRSFDSGLSWDTVKTVTDSTINELFYLNDSTIFALTDDEFTLIISKDSGKTWAYDFSYFTFFYPAMKAMVLSKTDSIVSVGQSRVTGKGIIYHFHAGSKFLTVTQADYKLNDVNKATDSIVFIVGDSGLILSNRSSILSVQHMAAKASDLLLYPNPTKGILISEMNEPHWIVIFDVLGRWVLGNIHFEPKHQLDLSHLAKGTYLVQIETKEGKVLHSKVLLQ